MCLCSSLRDCDHECQDYLDERLKKQGFTPNQHHLFEHLLTSRAKGTNRGAKGERSVTLQRPRLLRAIKTSSKNGKIYSGPNKLKIWEIIYILTHLT